MPIDSTDAGASNLFRVHVESLGAGLNELKEGFQSICCWGRRLHFMKIVTVIETVCHISSPDISGSLLH